MGPIAPVILTHGSETLHQLELSTKCRMLCYCAVNSRNIFPYMSAAYLKTCHRGNDSLCPIFRLGDVVREAGENFHEMAVEVRSPDLTFSPGTRKWSTRTWRLSGGSGLKIY